MAKRKTDKPLILVCDDNAEASESWTRRLQEISSVKSKYRVEAKSAGDLATLLDKLKSGLEELRKGQSPAEDPLKDVEVLVIDFDLLDATTQTGREFAYLARLVSSCGLIVALNEHGINTFDLTMSRYEESFADVNVGAEHFLSPGMWKQPWKGFRPWSWPLIPKEVASWNSRLKQVGRSLLDKPILPHFGLTGDVHVHLPVKCRQHIVGPKNKPPEEVTFREFAAHSPFCLRDKDRRASAKLHQRCIERIAAARVAHWLERVVGPGQNVLIDVPHLVERYPSLYNGRSRQPKSLDKLAKFGPVSELPVHYRKIGRHAFKNAQWVSRPMYLWPTISADDSIAEVQDPAQVSSLGAVFCEDVARFAPPDAAREYVADLASPYTRRFAADPSASHFEAFGEEIGRVNYEPAVRFSM